MKYLFAAFLVIACFTISLGQANEVLNNKSIVDLTAAGMSKKIILSKIEAATCKFTTDTKSLISLKKSGVDEDIIDAMVTKMASPGSGSTEKETTTAKNTTGEKEKSNTSQPASAGAAGATEKPSSQPSPLPDSKVIAFLKKEGSGIYYYDPSDNSIQQLESNVFSQQKTNNWNRAFTHGFGKSTQVMSIS
ncbi:MAG: hypothetical protein ABUT20_45800, partial [Bacteroidota bacterium]